MHGGKISSEAALAGDQRGIFNAPYGAADPFQSGAFGVRGHIAEILQRTPHYRAHQVAPVVGIGLMVFQRFDRESRGFGCGAERVVVRHFANEHGFGLRNTARTRFGAADADARVGDLAALQTIRDERSGQRKIAGAAIELVEAEFGLARQQWQPHLREQFVFRQRGRHDT